MDEERINDSLVEKLKFGQDIKAEFFVTFSAEVWFRHGARGLVKILKLKFGQYFEAGAYLRFDNFYRTRVRSLFTLVTNSLTDSLTN